MRKRLIARVTPWGTIQTGPSFARLSFIEQEAVLAHENGHLSHRHVLKRFLWLITLRAVFRFDEFVEMCEQQEFEADQYAVEQGCARGLCIFLSRRLHEPKSPGHPSAKQRLEAIHG